MARPYVIGVTGGIATGKSTVLAQLSELGATPIDADRVYHELIRPGRPLWSALRELFGPDILASDGSIDRARLAETVFSDPSQLRRLDALTHPAVVAEIERRIAAAETPVAAVDAVKLIESGLSGRCDEVWLVTADPLVQRQRLIARNGLTGGEADRRLAAQPDEAGRRPFATRILENSDTRHELDSVVLDAWRSMPI